MNKTIVVTGSAGFVGKTVTKYLIEQGYTVRALVRKNTNTAYLASLGAEIREGNLCSKSDLKAAFAGAEAVVHLASTMRGPWEEYQESTVNGTRYLLEAAEETKVGRVIYVSSIAVYDLTRFHGQEITEESPRLATNFSFYERSKIEAENVVTEFRDRVKTTVLRLGVVYGQNGELFPPRLGFSLGKNRYLVFGPGDNPIPLVYVGHVATAIGRALETDTPSNTVYNIVDDQKITQNDYLNAVRRFVNPNLRILHLPVGASFLLGKTLEALLKLLKRPTPLRRIYLILCTRHIRYSNKKAHYELGWNNPAEPEATLNQTMTWFKKRLDNARVLDYKRLQKTVILDRPVKVGIVGCGIIAKTHLDILKKIVNLKVVALCDPSIDLAQKLSIAYGVPQVYASIDEMLATQQIDAVHILTPPQTRRELCLKAIAKKCDIFLEKPMALNAEDARTICQAAAAANVRICLGHNHLFDPPMIEARRLITEGALGRIVSVETMYGFNLGANLASRYMLPNAEKMWAMQLPGSLYQNLISHPMSVIMDVMGYPKDICARATTGNVVKAMPHDELRVLCTNNGVIGTLGVSLAVNPRYQYLNIYGTEASIYVDFLNKTLTTHTTPKIVPKPVSRAWISIKSGLILITATIRNFTKLVLKRFTYYDGTEILIKDFYIKLIQGGPMPVPAEEGLATMEMMDEIWKQINEKSEIRNTKYETK